MLPARSRYLMPGSIDFKEFKHGLKRLGIGIQCLNSCRHCSSCLANNRVAPCTCIQETKCDADCQVSTGPDWCGLEGCSQVERLFAVLDVDGTHKIDVDEFLDAMETMQPKGNATHS